MIDLTDIRPLSDFQRNAKSHIKRLRKSGLPTVLTVNGKASVVVQDAAAYQDLINFIQEADSMARLAIGTAQAERGEGISIDEFDARIRRKYSLPKRRSA